MALLSVILPVYEEENNIGSAVRRISAALEGTGAEAELLFVDDGSRDGTWEQIRAASGAFQSVQLSAGQTLSCEPGAEVLLTSGSVTASGAFTDTTLGEALTDGALAVNHLYLAGDSAVLTANGDAALMVRGS